VKLKRSTNEPQKKRSRPASIDAVIDALTSYVKGQLLRPLSGAGRWLLFGIVGGVLVGAGVVFMLLGLLRLLQTEFSGISTADSRLSWLPYFIVLVIGVGVLIVTLQRINRTELFSDREQERVSE
jgi:TRAP-type C4-dicarboxylate transport system permease small subunit